MMASLTDKINYLLFYFWEIIFQSFLLTVIFHFPLSRFFYNFCNVFVMFYLVKQLGYIYNYIYIYIFHLIKYSWGVWSVIAHSNLDRIINNYVSLNFICTVSLLILGTIVRSPLSWFALWCACYIEFLSWVDKA